MPYSHYLNLHSPKTMETIEHHASLNISNVYFTNLFIDIHQRPKSWQPLTKLQNRHALPRVRSTNKNARSDRPTRGSVHLTELLGANGEEMIPVEGAIAWKKRRRSGESVRCWGVISVVGGVVLFFCFKHGGWDPKCQTSWLALLIWCSFLFSCPNRI